MVPIFTGTTGNTQRQGLIDDFKSGKILALINCQILTEGTDLSNTDCIIVGRPCCSPVLYTQIVGRGLRLDASKTDCLILDIIPAGGRKLCTISSLLGLEWDEAPDRFRDKMGQKIINYSDILSLINRIEEQVYDAVTKADEKTTEVGQKSQYQKCGDDSRSIYREHVYETRSFLTKIASLTEPAMDYQGKLAGIDSFYGMQTFRGQTADAAFIVRGKASDFEFHFSAADSDGKLIASAWIGNQVFVSSEPVSWLDAFSTTRKILRLDCPNNRYWIHALSEKWRSQAPTVREIAELTALVPSWMREYVKGAVGRYFSKWRVMLMIDYLERIREVHGKKVMSITGKEPAIIPFETLVDKYRNIGFTDTDDVPNIETNDQYPSVYSLADERLMMEYGITENHYNHLNKDDRDAIERYYNQAVYAPMRKIYIGHRLG